MPKKSLIIATLVLALVALATVFLDGQGNKPSDPRLGKELFAEVDLPQVKGLEVHKDDKKVVVEEGEGRRWRLADGDKFPVNVSKVISFVESLGKIKANRLIATSKDQWSAYELDKGNRVIVKGDGGKTLLDLTLGKTKEGGGQYVRFEGTEAVYLVDRETSVDTEAPNWELKTLTHIEKDGLKKVSFQPSATSKHKAFSLQREKKEDKFSLEGLSEKEQIKESELTAMDNNFRSISYSHRHPRDNEELQKALAAGPKVELETFTGDKVMLQAAEVVKKVPAKDKKDKPQDEKKYYVTASLSNSGAAEGDKVKFYEGFLGPWIFEIEAYQYKWFDRGRDEMVEPKKETPSSTPPQGS